MTLRQRDDDHLTSGQLAAMIDRRLRGAEHKAAVAHLSACIDCRHELAETQRALEEVGVGRRPMRRWSIAVAGLAAALVLAVVPIKLLSTRHGPADSAGATRASGAVPVDAVNPIAAVAPTEGAAISTDRKLVWRSAGPSASYLVTVQDTSGTVVWFSPLTDTAAVIPSTVPLLVGHRYFWSVDARLADGGSTKMDARAFTVP